MAIAEKLQNIINEKASQSTMTNYGLPSEEQITSSTKFIDYPKYIFKAFLESLNNPNTLFSNLPKITGTGSNITLNNTANAPMRIMLNAPDITQDSTTGKNILDNNTIPIEKSNNVNSSALETGIKMQYTGSTSASGTYDYGIFVIKDLSNYVGKILRVKANFTPSSNNTGLVVVGLCNQDGSNRSNKGNVASSGNTFSLVIPTLSDSQTYLYISIYANAGGERTQNCYVDYTNFIITLDNANMDYEPYTGGIASPNPQYPQDIHTISGSNKVVVCGKNLFDKDNYNIYNGYFIGTGTVSITSESSNNILYIPCQPNTQYAISKSAGKRFGIGYTTEIPTSGVSVYSVNSNNAGTELSITTGNDAKYLAIYVRNGNIGGELTLQQVLDSLQIEKDTLTATTYEPYTSQEADIDLKSTNIIGLDTAQYKVDLKAGDKLTITNETSSSVTFYCYTKYGDTTRNDYWGTASGLTKTITLAYDTEAIAWITAPVGKAWINKGITALPYMEYYDYGEYSKIGNYKDQFIRTSGKNLFDKDNATYKNNYIKDDDGNETSSGASGYLTSYISVKPNTTYTLQGTLSQGGQTIRFYYYNSNKEWISRTSSLEYATSYTFTTPNNCYYMQFQYIQQFYNANTIMLNEGTTALPYEPYGTDEWYLKKNIGKYTLPELESLTSSTIFGTAGQLGIYTLPNGLSSGRNYNFKCNKITQANEQFIKYGAFINNTEFRVITDTNDTLSNFNSNVSGSYVYYRLATPEYTPITGTLAEQLEYVYQLMKSYKGQTNISQVNNDLPFEFDVEAIEELV